MLSAIESAWYLPPSYVLEGIASGNPRYRRGSFLSGGSALADPLGPVDELLDTPGRFVREPEGQAALDRQELGHDPRGGLIPAAPGQLGVQALHGRGEAVVVAVTVASPPLREIDHSLHPLGG